MKQIWLGPPMNIQLSSAAIHLGNSDVDTSLIGIRTLKAEVSIWKTQTSNLKLKLKKNEKTVQGVASSKHNVT